MRIPQTVNASWIATLGDEQLIRAEATLHKQFASEETAEKIRMGERYTMLRGPESLVGAWLRWVMVNNETRTRGLVIHSRHIS